MNLNKQLFAFVILCMFIVFQIVNNGGIPGWSIFNVDISILESTNKLLSK